MSGRFRTVRPRRQRPVKGGRVSAWSGILPAVEAEIERDMRRYGVSRSFVIAVGMAHLYGHDAEQEHYDPAVEARRQKRGATRPLRKVG